MRAGRAAAGAVFGDTLCIEQHPKYFKLAAPLDDIAPLCASFGLFHDQRPELYRAVGTLDGRF